MKKGFGWDGIRYVIQAQPGLTASYMGPSKHSSFVKTASVYNEITGWDVFTLGATSFDKEFVRQNLNLVDIEGSSDDSPSDTDESEIKSDSSGESHGVSSVLNHCTCLTVSSSHWSTQTKQAWCIGDRVNHIPFDPP